MPSGRCGLTTSDIDQATSATRIINESEARIFRSLMEMSFDHHQETVGYSDANLSSSSSSLSSSMSMPTASASQVPVPIQDLHGIDLSPSNIVPYVHVKPEFVRRKNDKMNNKNKNNKNNNKQKIRSIRQQQEKIMSSSQRHHRHQQRMHKRACSIQEKLSTKLETKFTGTADEAELVLMIRITYVPVLVRNPTSSSLVGQKCIQSLGIVPIKDVNISYVLYHRQSKQVLMTKQIMDDCTRNSTGCASDGSICIDLLMKQQRKQQRRRRREERNPFRRQNSSSSSSTSSSSATATTTTTTTATAMNDFLLELADHVGETISRDVFAFCCKLWTQLHTLPTVTSSLSSS